MARPVLALLLSVALASPGAAVLSQPPLQSVDRAPTSIDDLLDQETDVEPEGMAPTAPQDLGLTSEQLDLRIRGASAAAQALQGPMDGAWTLEDARGAPLYVFQFADPANNPTGALEGAWRDLRRGEGLSGAGLIASVQRTSNMLQASFSPKGGAETAAVSLIQGAGGVWSGQLTQAGVTVPVRMIRSEPMLNAAPLRYAGGDVVSPYRTPASNTRAAAPASKSAKGKAVKGKAAKGKKTGTKAAPAKSKAKTPAKKKTR